MLKYPRDRVHTVDLHGGIFKFFCQTFGETANPEFSGVIDRLPSNSDHAKNGGGINKHGFGAFLQIG